MNKATKSLFFFFFGKVIFGSNTLGAEMLFGNKIIPYHFLAYDLEYTIIINNLK